MYTNCTRKLYVSNTSLILLCIYLSRSICVRQTTSTRIGRMRSSHRWTPAERPGGTMTPTLHAAPVHRFIRYPVCTVVFIRGIAPRHPFIMSSSCIAYIFSDTLVCILYPQDSADLCTKLGRTADQGYTYACTPEAYAAG